MEIRKRYSAGLENFIRDLLVDDESERADFIEIKNLLDSDLS